MRYSNKRKQVKTNKTVRQCSNQLDKVAINEVVDIEHSDVVIELTGKELFKIHRDTPRRIRRLLCL